MPGTCLGIRGWNLRRKMPWSMNGESTDTSQSPVLRFGLCDAYIVNFTLDFLDRVYIPASLYPCHFIGPFFTVIPFIT